MKRSGQVWIESVLYTVIGLALIGIALGLVSPKISEYKDRIVVEQTVNSLKVLDDKIDEAIVRGPGNVRVVPEFTIKRGEMYIDTSKDEILFIIRDLKKPYSQPGVNISLGRVQVLSKEGQKSSEVYLTLSYRNSANITYDGSDSAAPQKFNAANIPYKFQIENNGNSGVNTEISIKESSDKFK